MTVDKLISELNQMKAEGVSGDAVVVIPLVWDESERFCWKVVEAADGTSDDLFAPNPDAPNHGTVGSDGTEPVVTIW